MEFGRKYDEALRSYNVCFFAYSDVYCSPIYIIRINAIWFLGLILSKFYYLKKVSKSSNINIHVAAISAFVANQLEQVDPYPFCKNPLDFFHVGNLGSYSQNVDKLINDLITEAEKQNPLWEPKNKSTISGFQTSNNIFQVGKTFSMLEEFIIQEIEAYYSKFSTESCSLIKLWPTNYTIKGWYVRLVKDGHQTSHIHRDGWISGVVYLKTVSTAGTNEGSIELGLHGYELPVINQNYPRKIHYPRTADIILFPSSLFHKTIPFSKRANRCVVAFDLIPSRP